jgi:hypothetical protein
MKKLMEDIAAFANVLGVSDPDLVWTLATVPWKSVDDRNNFITEIGLMDGGVEQ